MDKLQAFKAGKTWLHECKTDKRCHVSRAAAKKHLKSLKGNRKDGNIYRCKFCGHYHITSLKKGERR